jgi:hypothetical protein
MQESRKRIKDGGVIQDVLITHLFGSFYSCKKGVIKTLTSPTANEKKKKARPICFLFF